MPIPLIIGIVIGGIILVFAIFMAIATAVAKGGSDKIFEVLDTNRTNALNRLSGEGFKISKRFEISQFAYGKNGNAIDKPFVGVFIDETNKRVAFASYKDGLFLCLHRDQIRHVEFIEKTKTSSTDICLKMLNLIVYTKMSLEPYKIKVLQFAVYSVSSKFKDMFEFKDKVTEAINNLMQKN